MFTNPDKSIAQFGLREGMRVAEFGAGGGFMTRSIASRVGHTGLVYAIEVQKDLVKKLEKDLKDWQVSNTSVIWGDVEKVGGTKIADHSMDAVVISNILFQAEDRLGLIDEAKRILKKGGRVLFIDWLEMQKQHNMVTEKKAIELFTLRGFKFIENISKSDHHYGIIFINE